LIPFSLISFLIVGIEVSYGGWIFTYYRENNFGSMQMGYTLNAIFWLSISAGRLMSIPAAVKIKPRPMIYAYLLGGAASAGLMIVFPAHNWAVWIGTIGIGLSLSAVFPTLYNDVKQKIHIRGKSTGLVWSIGSLGAVIMPWLIGRVMTGIGLVWMMITILGGWILGVGLFLILLRIMALQTTPE
jgi:fucose permease